MKKDRMYRVGRNVLLLLFIYGFPVVTMIFVFLSMLEGQILKSIGIYLSAIVTMGISLGVLIHYKNLKIKKWQHRAVSKKLPKNYEWKTSERVFEKSTLL